MLRGEKTVLREKQLSDADNDYAWRSDRELARLDAASPVHLTRREFMAYYSEELRNPSRKRRRLAIDSLDGKHIGTVADTDWQIKGTDDYNGDLKPDILWQNVVTGEISVWLMDDDEILAITDIATVDDPDWMIVAPK